MEHTQTAAEALLRLEEPFASKDVKWLVAATTKDGSKGRVTPYADPRAYTDRLNEVVTASGWTRQYTVYTISPVTRIKKDKPIQTGKVLVTCVVTITGIGSHSGSGEEWADDENAMTSAEAQAFKRACSIFGLGRYFYNFAEMWVEVDQYKQPKQLPKLPSWALSRRERETAGEDRPTTVTAAKTAARVQKGPLDAGVTAKIEGCRRELGSALFADVLKRVASVRSARDIPNQKLQQIVFSSMERCARAMTRIREIAAELPETEFYAILDDVHVPSLNRIPNFDVLRELANTMNRAASNRSVA
jgi:hypothetical protein